MIPNINCYCNQLFMHIGLTDCMPVVTIIFGDAKFISLQQTRSEPFGLIKPIQPISILRYFIISVLLSFIKIRMQPVAALRVGMLDYGPLMQFSVWVTQFIGPPSLLAHPLYSSTQFFGPLTFLCLAHPVSFWSNKVLF